MLELFYAAMVEQGGFAWSRLLLRQPLHLSLLLDIQGELQ